MSLRFLVDTNVLSEPSRPQPNLSVLERLGQHRNEIATATVVWHELLFGCYRLPVSKKRQAIESYLTNTAQFIPLLAYNTAAATWHARERARLANIGRTPAFADGQIAAIAAVNDLILVTNNESDYSSFLNLQVENWFVA